VCQDFHVQPTDRDDDLTDQPDGVARNDDLHDEVPSETVVSGTLRPPRRTVSKRAIGYWTARAVPPWLIIAGIQVIWWLNDTGDSSGHVIGLIVTAAFAAIHLTVMPNWRFRVHRWETTPQAVYTQAGWFNQERRIAPISRIQTVDSHRGPFEQLFRLSNVTVTTASAAGPLRIHGLDREVAQQLVDELTSITQATPGDAT
jgi:uncharacterized protein